MIISIAMGCGRKEFLEDKEKLPKGVTFFARRIQLLNPQPQRVQKLLRRFLKLVKI